MRQPQRALERRCHGEARRHRHAHDMLHVDRLALADERAIEHGVEHLLGVAIAIRQVEIIRADALDPFAEHEAHVTAVAGGDDRKSPRLNPSYYCAYLIPYSASPHLTTQETTSEL